MSEIITTIVYRLDELSDAAKYAVRAWYREGAPFDDWHESVFEDFASICAILGVDLATHNVRLYGGGTRQEPNIWFSGFWNQGDGACFEGAYQYATGSARKIRRYAPEDAELHRIADALASIQRTNFYQLEARIRHEGRYSHEYTMAIEIERAGLVAGPITRDVEEAAIETLRDLARWLYRQLQREYEYLTSDNVVDETILANDYTFTEAGERFP